MLSHGIFPAASSQVPTYCCKHNLHDFCMVRSFVRSFFRSFVRSFIHSCGNTWQPKLVRDCLETNKNVTITKESNV